MAQDPSHPLGFPRSRRLKSSAEFLHAKTKGQRLAFGCLIANWIDLPENTKSRLGVVTSRKIGNAVIRSRARRLLRESFRLHQNEIARPVNLVLIARQSITGKRFADVERDFLRAMAKANLLNP